MMKIFYYFAVAAVFLSTAAGAQSFKETFDANSLGWTECTFKNKDNIQFYIEKGQLVVHSERNTNIMTGKTSYSFAESFCYAPLDVLKPFKIIMHLKYDNEDFPCGFRFNEKDDGNFYDISLMENSKKVLFDRYENDERIGGLSQGFAFPKKSKKEFYEVVLVSEHEQLTLTIQDIPVFTIKYMPLTYDGFSFFTYGEQEMIVDDVEFIQL